MQQCPNIFGTAEQQLSRTSEWSADFVARLSPDAIYNAVSQSSHIFALSHGLADQLIPLFTSTGVVEQISLADSGAVGLLSPFCDEFDNKVRSNILWSSASNDGNTVDWTGDYRLFLADHEKRIVHFQHLWGLCVESMSLELFGICQLNTFCVGYDSPPINQGSPYLYRGSPDNKIHECRILQNGLPHIQNIHTHEMLGLLLLD